MHIVATNFTKALVWVHKYDDKLWCHKQRTPNTMTTVSHWMKTPSWNFLRVPLICIHYAGMDIHKHLLATFSDGDIAAYLDLAISINGGLQKAWPIRFYL